MRICRCGHRRCIRAVSVRKPGGSNIQFAINPENGDMVVVEMNPRFSRIVQPPWPPKATGFPDCQNRLRQARRRLHAG